MYAFRRYLIGLKLTLAKLDWYFLEPYTDWDFPTMEHPRLKKLKVFYAAVLLAIQSSRKVIAWVRSTVGTVKAPMEQQQNSNLTS